MSRPQSVTDITGSRSRFDATPRQSDRARAAERAGNVDDDDEDRVPVPRACVPRVPVPRVPAARGVMRAAQ